MPAAAAAPAAAAVEEAPVEVRSLPSLPPSFSHISSPASNETLTPEKPKEKTIFNVMLKSFDPAIKPKVIREVKALVPNLTLMEAKKFVESVPQVLKENLAKEDAEKLKATFESLGAVIELE
ncbi:hypothetical protein SERLADRAFT_435033 [Serpula lacrymans var. lacrymans S7.9]|uniref:Large ribosomal subunit protein bL12 C-terminal domain-containing protein n=1 Tax=Serpula lacrymans var. lacrymans (strain S7.9) TaxID=578457 RepID=F8NLW3_SERL9|nr:uncharacterized protein SERLADRAFT_435033 [Serpula lacrymans var. lacrymans S7.9]EGO27267.1 hypothetical protein SERLADRAFT_435033 [Serpula lacrymans var. lacrymans S7.9]